MSKTPIRTKKAPEAIGPYSQGIAAAGLVFTSGQLPMDMATGELERNDIKAATRHCLSNVAAILEAGGASMADVVKTTVFLTDMALFADVNAAYAEFFGDTPPARSCIEVAALPKGALIEIEAVAVK
ncbi:RidA family protein [Oscillospiraceae bacterium OttesenSCG-928-F05]|nr:RidA family protein [Oscillospiraceae bacterium OttesenSCG-928-F05]